MTFDQLLEQIYEVIIEPLLFLLFGVALIIFIWGIVQFIHKSGESKDQADGKRNMIWGMVGMLIMVSVFSIISIIIGTFGIEREEGWNTAEQRFKGTIEGEIDIGNAQ